MRQLSVLIFIALTLIYCHAFGAEKYICTSEKTIGFKYNKTSKEWQAASFSEHKYVISKPEDAKAEFVVTEIGSSYPLATCKYPIQKEYGWLNCESGFSDFRFNKINGRFMRSFMSGYISVLPSINGQTDETSDTPSMEIGKCSSF